jgi:hypothetical protein
MDGQGDAYRLVETKLAAGLDRDFRRARRR